MTCYKARLLNPTFPSFGFSENWPTAAGGAGQSSTSTTDIFSPSASSTGVPSSGTTKSPYYFPHLPVPTPPAAAVWPGLSSMFGQSSAAAAAAAAAYLPSYFPGSASSFGAAAAASDFFHSPITSRSLLTETPSTFMDRYAASSRLAADRRIASAGTDDFQSASSSSAFTGHTSTLFP